MFIFPSILIAIFGATAALASVINSENPLRHLVTQSSVPRNGNGTHDGFFYYFWSDGQGDITYTNEAGGRYSTTWNNTGNFVAGKGWSVGTGRNISYRGTWDGAAGNSYVSLYGWTENPMVEYYIMDSFGTYDPGSSYAKPQANVTVDGSTYNIYTNWRTYYSGGEPPFYTTFRQVWSVRQQRRVGGTINAQAHFDAWTQAGVKLGNHSYQILATEAYQYKKPGSATITVLDS